MDMSRVEQSGVGAHDARRNPGEMRTSLAAPGATLDHVLEILVEGDPVAALAHHAAQPAGDVKVIERHHRAIHRREPFHGAKMTVGK
ncbi:hypothetical protein AUC71_09820 [Methyloceanibacter marginalis]|uniref:Uncharacterized protein n=1 Tax=Methyloceanibacter marginalis TaxID=1774971 RepID=A0A1E3WC59_9HYPH|nr:hypothetical protein AUC71_09820 [Methyloceanibacter marginalis]